MVPLTAGGRTCIPCRRPTDDSGTAPSGTGGEHGTAYVLGSDGKPKIVWAADVKRAIDAGDNSARHQQFRCGYGDTLVFVQRSCTGRVEHFRHKHIHELAPGDVTPSGAAVMARVSCGCSTTHIEAQALIQRHISRLSFKTWRACGKHGTTWQAGDGAIVVLEESAEFNGNKVRYDDAVYQAGERVKVIEVRHTSKTRPEKRPKNTIEVWAEDVIAKICSSDGLVCLDNLMTTDEPCPECETLAAADTEFLKEHEEGWAEMRQRKAREEAREAAPQVLPPTAPADCEEEDRRIGQCLRNLAESGCLRSQFDLHDVQVRLVQILERVLNDDRDWPVLEWLLTWLSAVDAAHTLEPGVCGNILSNCLCREANYLCRECHLTHGLQVDDQRVQRLLCIVRLATCCGHSGGIYTTLISRLDMLTCDLTTARARNLT